MTEPAAYNSDVVPTITLAGKQWPVPPLAPRQFRKIFDDLISVTDALDAALPMPPPGQTSNDLAERVLKLSSEVFEKLQNCVYWGLTRAHPEMTMDEFLDMPATPPQLVHAFLIVRVQTGMFVSREAAGEGGNPGEAGGANAP